MKTEWDYTNLAVAYLKRPSYAETAIDEMLLLCNIKENDRVCDIGAGVAHLTIPLLHHNLTVDAIEPNDSMRRIGSQRTKAYENCQWFEGTGENTGMLPNQYKLVTFGSSFNVCERNLALIEAKRILIPKGWFACMWNHRKLDNPIQMTIESIINKNIPTYGYGIRRLDQTEVIKGSNLFGEIVKIEGQIEHTQSIHNCIEAWKSHATLERQAGVKFNTVIEEITEYLESLNEQEIRIPYTTIIWVSQLLS